MKVNIVDSVWTRSERATSVMVGADVAAAIANAIRRALEEIVNAWMESEASEWINQMRVV